jgi:hypothetical protein
MQTSVTVATFTPTCGVKSNGAWAMAVASGAARLSIEYPLKRPAVVDLRCRVGGWDAKPAILGHTQNIVLVGELAKSHSGLENK